MERSLKNPLCAELYKLPLPDLSFQMITTPSTKHTSDHLPIDTVNIRTFNALSALSADFDIPDAFESGSLFLGSVRKRTVHFSDIDSLVKLLFKDIITLCSLDNEANIHSQYSITSETGSKHTKHMADFYIVWLHGRPVIVIEVKSPLTDVMENKPVPIGMTPPVPVLDDTKVLGQLYDYMQDLQSFYGQRDVFGIVTTLKHFKLAWFPHSDACAASLVSVAPTEPLHRDEMPDTATRTLSTTEQIPYTSESLIRMIMSAVIKAKHSQFHPVSIVATSRLYIQLLSNGWFWNRLSVAECAKYAQKLTFALKETTSSSPHYTVIKYLTCGPDCKVWVATVHDSVSLCVIKQSTSFELAQQELSMWRMLNGVENASVARILGKHSLIMPFVFTATEFRDGSVGFNTGFNAWGFQDNVTVGEVPALLRSQIETIDKIMVEKGYLDAQTVAAEAISRAADKLVTHSDLDWRHVAIMPLFDGSKTKVTDLLPVLIDFDHVTLGVHSPAAALDPMKEYLEYMCAGKRFRN